MSDGSQSRLGGHVPSAQRGAARPRIRRLALVLALAAGLALGACGEAAAFTLKLVFPDGRPMTYGSACTGDGCLQRGDRLQPTDAEGEVVLADGPGRAVEYRRDGIALARVPPGSASGRLVALGDRTTVVVPRLLSTSAPAVDPVESDLVARLNEARAAYGLPLAQLNALLSAAADMQAAWLTRSDAAFERPDLFHTGPFDTTMGFRHGEVSLPDAAVGGEIAEAGATSAGEAVADWLASPPHREQVLAPGRLLIGVGQVGGFIVVDTHPPCAGCEQGGPGVRAAGAAAPPGVTPAALPPLTRPAAAVSPAPTRARPVTAGGVADPARSCGRERLRVRRIADHDGRVRLRLRLSCLRRGRYALIARQGRSGRVLRTREISRAETMTLHLRPSRATRSLRVELRRDERTVVARAISLRR
jgi:hypothetical protein